MGVDIGVCKNLVKISDDVENIDYDELDEKCDGYFVILKYEEDWMIEPFTKGVYKYEPGKTHTQFSYGGNADFLDMLDRIGDETGNPFTTTRDCAGIENCVSYKIVEEMLEEFEVNKEVALKHFEEFDDFYVGRYNTYIEVLKECIECKGLLRYS